MSDTELLKLKALSVIRAPGRPKENRYMGSSDYYAKRQNRRAWDGMELMLGVAGEGKKQPRRKRFLVVRIAALQDTLQHNAGRSM
jgi:hypothetical protein